MLWWALRGVLQSRWLLDCFQQVFSHELGIIRPLIKNRRLRLCIGSVLINRLLRLCIGSLFINWRLRLLRSIEQIFLIHLAGAHR